MFSRLGRHFVVDRVGWINRCAVYGNGESILVVDCLLSEFCQVSIHALERHLHPRQSVFERQACRRLRILHEVPYPSVSGIAQLERCDRLKGKEVIGINDRALQPDLHHQEGVFRCDDIPPHRREASDRMSHLPELIPRG